MSKKNECPFVVGDIIKGKPNYYGFTNENMTKAEVVSVYDGYMDIRILSEGPCLEIGEEYNNVENSLDCFDYFYPFKKGDMICGTEKSDHKYGATNQDMTRGVVIDVEKYQMRVKILKHKDEYFQYMDFWVENSLKYFKPCGATPEPELVPVVHDPNSGITITTDHVKNVTVAYEDCKAEANCNLECGDKFNYKFSLGLALERLGKKLQDENEPKTNTRKAKIVELKPIDEGCGLSEGDIVDILEFDALKSGIYVRCLKSTYHGLGNVQDKYSFPVQYLSHLQYELIEEGDIWKKAYTPTKYVRILKIPEHVAKHSGVKKGDIVEVLLDHRVCLYVKSPKKNNGKFSWLGKGNEEYFTFLGFSSEWEYVTKG